MAGKIHRYDCYDIRKFGSNYVRGFLDIGANVGTTTIMAKILFPIAKIVAFEPCIETYKKLETYVGDWMTKQDKLYNFAMGDGTDLCFLKRSSSGMYRFLLDNDIEKKWWPKDFEYSIKSKTLAQIFDENKIEAPYIIKIDTEGGERFLLQQTEAIDIIKGSLQTMIEIHPSFGGTPKQWDKWFTNFSDTHKLKIGIWEGKQNKDINLRKYKYISCNKISKQTKQYELVSRKWEKR